MEDYRYKKEMEDKNLDNDMEHHWRMVFDDNSGGADNKKALIYPNRWDVYMNEE